MTKTNAGSKLLKEDSWKTVLVPSRPGSQDALKVPSIVGGKKVKHQPPSPSKSGMVGNLKDMNWPTGGY